jgi:hypothetical protein
MSVCICAWCGKTLRQSPTPENSHGACRPCAARQLKEIPFWLRVKARAKPMAWSMWPWVCGRLSFCGWG